MHASTVNNPCLDELARLQLERNALELEANGYTVVEDALDPDLTARGLEAALRRSRSARANARTSTRARVTAATGYGVSCC